MADVFISYSKQAVAVTRKLAKDLEEKGVTVWWDTELVAGERFRQRIQEELKACRAAIVIWTPESVHSDYVHSEAERARIARKLIQVRTADIEPGDLPPPFDVAHVPLVDDRTEIYAALSKLGIIEGYDSPAYRKTALFTGAAGRAPWRFSTRTVGIAVGVLAIATAWLGYQYVLVNASRAPSEAELIGRGSTVAAQFLKQVNAGIPDSSLFAKELRLGRRGLMTSVEAVAELRKFNAKYQSVVCQVDPSSVKLKPAQHPASVWRVNFVTQCDVAAGSGPRTTERFPLEIEATRSGGADRIAGIWAPERMVLWEARN